MAPRYELKKSLDESWTVIHVFTGQPADAWGALTEGLDECYARDLVDAMNAVDLKRRLATDGC
ncbi:hypothetical protein FJ426_26365 [Mesorhizobium sp. B2-6-4]|nr:hypothetical protein FJ426_26365 [Mesorhizobium sp. B2-6-4]